MLILQKAMKQTVILLFLCVLFVSLLLVVKTSSTTKETFETPEQKLKSIQDKIVMSYGTMNEEYPEQLLAVKYIKPDDIVLEIGGNIGRNSCVMSHLLSDSRNLLVLESDPDTAQQLMHNRDQNKLQFKIENSAISKVDLYQNQSNTSPTNYGDGWKKIPTKPWEEIKAKYNMPFNALVVDCEGALYYILQENPGFLQPFKTIIIENDFTDLTHKHFVDNEFTRFGFKRVHHEAGGWQPCYDFFYEVWVKN